MESLLHSNLKTQIYAGLQSRGFPVRMETAVAKSRPDLLTEIDGKKLAIEIQHSALTPRSILYRMNEHTKHGAHTLWLIPEQVLESILYHRSWCELIQRLQYGFVFIPSQGCQILPAHIDILYGTKIKYIDRAPAPIGIEDVLFEKNPETGLNTTYWNEWWIDGYIELNDIMAQQKLPKMHKMPTKIK